MAAERKSAVRALSEVKLPRKSSVTVRTSTGPKKIEVTNDPEGAMEAPVAQGAPGQIPVEEKKRRTPRRKTPENPRIDPEEKGMLTEITDSLDKLGFRVKGAVQQRDNLALVEAITPTGKRVAIDVSRKATGVAGTTLVSTREPVALPSAVEAFRPTCIDRNCSVILPCENGICILTPLRGTLQNVSLAYDERGLKTTSFTAEPSPIPIPVVNYEEVLKNPLQVVSQVDAITPILRNAVMQSKTVILGKIGAEMMSMLPEAVQKTGSWGEQLFRLVYADLTRKAAGVSSAASEVQKALTLAIQRLGSFMTYVEAQLAETRLQMNPDLYMRTRGMMPTQTPDQLQALETKYVDLLEEFNRNYDALVGEIDRLDITRQSVSPLIKSLADETVVIDQLMKNPCLLDRGYDELAKFVETLQSVREGLLALLEPLNAQLMDIVNRMKAWDALMAPPAPPAPEGGACPLPIRARLSATPAEAAAMGAGGA